MVIIFFLVFYAIFAPLIGIILVENGWYSISAGLEGYSNGAWLIYLLHSVFLLLGIIFVYKIQIRNRYNVSSIRHLFNQNRILFKSLSILLLFLILMLFLFKGYLTLTGVGKAFSKGEPASPDCRDHQQCHGDGNHPETDCAGNRPLLPGGPVFGMPVRYGRGESQHEPLVRISAKGGNPAD